MKRTVIIISLGLAALSLVACGPSAVQVTLERSLRAATSRSVGCPSAQIGVYNHQPAHNHWAARACKRTYSCVGVNLEQEFAECKETDESRKARGVATRAAWGAGVF